MSPLNHPSHLSNLHICFGQPNHESKANPKSSRTWHGCQKPCGGPTPAASEPRRAVRPRGLVLFGSDTFKEQSRDFQRELSWKGSYANLRRQHVQCAAGLLANVTFEAACNQSCLVAGQAIDECFMHSFTCTRSPLRSRPTLG